MTLQESANSQEVQGLLGESTQAILNISALNLISVIIESSNGNLDGNVYEIWVSNDNNNYHYLRSVPMQGTSTNNSFGEINQSVFGNILSYNFLKIKTAAIPGVQISVIISGR